ncbi:dihydrodipicolinate synthase family protein [Exiguobacterium artemiae]|uniref:dihydrodipicolinate synthase family protein n=1 Tax=Exiguobacterium artemiae TaxID=340145 RepID=UPI00047C44BF|nr:dihydrodipicolinate synthase family protein [Exiguobacterium sibiricum]
MLKEAFHIAVPTAFFPDETLNVDGTIEHIRYLVDQGEKSILVCGSTGEQHSLELKEKLVLLEALMNEAYLLNDEIEVLFGVSAIRQKEAVDLAHAIKETRIAGILLGYSPYLLPSQTEALRYSETIIQASQKDTILYNNPGRTGFDLSIESIIQLSAQDKVIGIKEAGNKNKVERLQEHISDFYYYAGGEVDLKDKIALGFNRLSSISGNVYPKEIRKWFFSLIEDTPLAESEQKEVTALINTVFAGSPIVHLKREINAKGIAMGICRSPLGNC